MKYVIDANVWLQPMVGLPYAADVLRLLSQAPVASLATTDFALHSIGTRLARARPEQYRDFIDDFATRMVSTLHFAPSSLHAVVDAVERLGLDFDDAFQYVAAERDDLTIVSFDADFDRTPRGRKTPAQVLADIAAPPPSP